MNYCKLHSFVGSAQDSKDCSECRSEREKQTCCVCGEEGQHICGNCENKYCDKHYKTTVMTGNCCSGNEKDYE